MKYAPRLIVGLFVIMSFCSIRSYPGMAAFGEEQKPAPTKKPARIVKFESSSQNLKKGDEAVFTATVRNESSRVVLVSVRLLTSPQIQVVAPEGEQTCFVEPDSNRIVKWYVKIVDDGRIRASTACELIAEGRTSARSSTEIPPDAKSVVETVWAGQWESPDSQFDAEMHLRLDPSGSVDGYIDWTMTKLLVGSAELKTKVGHKGREYVWGTYDPDSRTVSIEGYRRDDPQQILGIDWYRLKLADDNTRLDGISREKGTWSGKFTLLPKHSK